MARGRFKGLIGLVLFLISALRLSAADPVPVNIRMAPENCLLIVDGEVVEQVSKSDYVKFVKITPGSHNLAAWRPGYEEKELPLSINGSAGLVEVKLEKRFSALSQAAVLATGTQPKCVEFTPDGKYFLVALLEGPGIDLFSTETFEKIKTIAMPDNYARYRGFVEIAFLPALGEIWVSQMTTDSIHVIDLDSFTYKSSFYTGGSWSKVITVSKDESIACVSNWLSMTVTVFSTKDKKLLATIKIPGTPRGMSMTPDNRYLYVCNYDTGTVHKLDLISRKLIATIDAGPGAKRHCVLDDKTGRLYVSDMATGYVSVIDTATDRIVAEKYIDEKLNTIKLSPDRNYLFVSSRGPNNLTDYTLKGPRFGKVYVLSAETLDTFEWVWGMNQPTGIDISPDGKILAFTDFLDKQVEVYRFEPDRPEPALPQEPAAPQ